MLPPHPRLLKIMHLLESQWGSTTLKTDQRYPQRRSRERAASLFVTYLLISRVLPEDGTTSLRKTAENGPTKA